MLVGLNLVKVNVLINFFSGMLYCRLIDIVMVKLFIIVWKLVFFLCILMKILLSVLFLYLFVCRYILCLLMIVFWVYFLWCFGSFLWWLCISFLMIIFLIIFLVRIVVFFWFDLVFRIFVVLLLFLISVVVNGCDSLELLWYSVLVLIFSDYDSL